MVATLYRFESYYTHHFISLWRNRQDANGSKPFCYGFNSHQTYHLQRDRIVVECSSLLNYRISLLFRGFKSLCHIGVWCNGSIALPKSEDWGSSPCTPASTNSFMEKSICKSIVEQDVGLKVSIIKKWTISAAWFFGRKDTLLKLGR